MCVDLDLDLGAGLKAHRTPGQGLDGFPEDSAYRPAMPYVEQGFEPWTSRMQSGRSTTELHAPVIDVCGSSRGCCGQARA